MEETRPINYISVDIGFDDVEAKGAGLKRIKNIPVGRLQTEEGIETLCMELADAKNDGIIIASFESDGSTNQQIAVYEAIKNKGMPLGRLIVNGIVPCIDNIDFINKLAVECRAVLLNGFFNRRVLNAYLFEELMVTVKYLLLNSKQKNYSIVFEEDFNEGRHTSETVLKRKARIVTELERLHVDEEKITALFDNQWLV